MCTALGASSTTYGWYQVHTPLLGVRPAERQGWRAGRAAMLLRIFLPGAVFLAARPSSPCGSHSLIVALDAGAIFSTPAENHASRALYVTNPVEPAVGLVHQVALAID